MVQDFSSPTGRACYNAAFPIIDFMVVVREDSEWLAGFLFLVLDSRVSKTGNMRLRFQYRIMKFQKGSNFFHPPM